MKPPESSTCHLCTIRDDRANTPFAGLLTDRDHRTQVLSRDDHCLTIIDVAPIGPGHCLIVPARHRLSLAQTSSEEKAAIADAMAMAASAIAAAFSIETVFFEHGQCTEGVGVTGCGISHAHLHAVGRRDDAEIDRVGDLDLEPLANGIQGLNQYQSSAGYLFVQDGLGNAFACRPGKTASGLLRSHFAWPGYLAEESHAHWSWSDHVTYASLVGTGSRVSANLDALTRARGSST